MVGKSINSNAEAAWRWMCQQDSFDLLEVAEGSPLKLRNIYLVVRSWLASGHLRCVYQKPFGSSVSFRGSRYQVVETAGDPAFGSGNRKTKQRQKRRIHRKTVQQKMWNTMKISRFFTLTDLMLTAETGQKQAWFYTDRLVKAGYVKVLFKVDSLLPVPARHGLTGRYQLVRDTGRYAPLCRDHGCWDQNQQQLYPFQREEETHGNVA